jgi:hypothetical protein
MEHDALTIYLNDHLAGATLGCDHARQLEEMSKDTPFGPTMTRLAKEIEDSRDTLVELMARLDATRNPVKQAGAWVAEKVGRFKFSGLSSADRELGRYLTLEMMSLGVQGQWSLWTALERVCSQYPELQATDLTGLIARAEAQRDALETERLRTAELAFATATQSPSVA